jgi:hypothetical protein
MVITGSGQLEAAMSTVLSKVADAVADRALDLLRDTVLSVVYSRGGSDWYIRDGMDGGLAGAWDKIEEYTHDTIVNSIRAVGFRPDKISWDAENYHHGSPKWALEGDPDDLPTIIFDGYEVFNTGIEIDARDAWSEFNTELNANIGTWVVEECAKFGIVATGGSSFTSGSPSSGLQTAYSKDH